MKRLMTTIAVSASLLLLVVSSSGQQVRYNFLPDVDFTKYTSYRWVDVLSPANSNAALGEHIKEAIDSELSRKGLKRADSGNAELVVAYQIAITQERQWKAHSTDDGYWGWGGWGGWGSNSDPKSTIISKGTLNVDVYDSAMKKQIWRGEITKIVRRENNAERIRKNVATAVAKLLSNFPPLSLKKGN